MGTRLYLIIRSVTILYPLWGDYEAYDSLCRRLTIYYFFSMAYSHFRIVKDLRLLLEVKMVLLAVSESLLLTSFEAIL